MKTAGRRIVTVSGFAAAWILCVGTAPIWLPVAAIVDLVRRRRGVALRSAAMVTVYLSCEMAGIAACAGLWIWKHTRRVEAEHWLELHFRLEAWWAATLFWALVRLFGLRLEVAGDANLSRGPYLLMLRHASEADSLLASAFVARPVGMRLRYVLKRELLWDPCMDIVGNRLPNAFVDRVSGDTEAEIRRVKELAQNLGPRDGLLIYPEGTRFSARKRAQVLEHFEREGDTRMLAYARSLECVLPPRTGGALALIEAASEADVIMCAHTGFEGAASLGQVWRGALIHATFRVQFRRIPRSEVPNEPDDRRDWLLEEWRKVDAWVKSNRAA